MAWIQRFWSTLRYRGLGNELDEEIRFHIESRSADNVAAGIDPAEARKTALRQFGNQALTRERAREMDTLGWLETIGKDLLYAGRIMRRSPSFTFFAIAAMSLGIGSTTLMFSIVNSVLLEPLPYKNPSALFTLWQTSPEEDRISFSPRDFRVWEKETQVFEGLAAHSGNGFTITGQGEPEMIIGEMVSPSFFDVLGAQPSIGRAFLPSEGLPGNDHQVVLSNRLWREKFGGRTQVVGEQVMMNDEPYTIVGVMPPNFFVDFAYRYKLWVPVAWTSLALGDRDSAHIIQVVGRLKPGMSRRNLLAEIAVLEKRSGEIAHDPNRRYLPISMKDLMTGDLQSPLMLLLIAVGLLLAIACTNVANLTLERAISRRKEIAIRGALGASRKRLLGQALIESTLLALVGGVIGFVLAIWGVRLVILFGASNVPALAHSHISLWTAAFAFVISALSGILFGLVPAFTASKMDFQTALKEGGRSSKDAGAGKTRNVLAWAEIAIASVLLLGSGLMVRSYVALTDVDPGFRPEGTIAANVVLKPHRYPEASRLLEFYRAAMSRVRQIPGITASGMAASLPFTGSSWDGAFEVEGRPAPAGQEYSAQLQPISPGYFAAMGIQLDRGRDFTDLDNADSSYVAVVNVMIARRFWEGEDPIGKRIRLEKGWLSVVGVCGNIKHEDLAGTSQSEIYVPYLQLSPELLRSVGRDCNYVIRTEANPESFAGPLRSAIGDNVVKVRTVQKLVDESIAEPRFRTWLLSLFAVLALMLASLGIYGVISYNVVQRSRDFGIRIALGASGTDIITLVLRQSLGWMAAGILSGVVVAAALSGLLSSMVFGISVYDPVTYAGVPVFLFFVAVAAGYAPARRATRVDPLISLRNE